MGSLGGGGLGLLLGHHVLHGSHSLLHLSLHLIQLNLLHLDDLLDLLGITLEHLQSPLAVLFGGLRVLFDEIAGTNFYENILSVFHHARDVK